MPNAETAPPAARNGRGGKAFDLEERTAAFGEAVIRFCKGVLRHVITEPLLKQLVHERRGEPLRGG